MADAWVTRGGGAGGAWVGPLGNAAAPTEPRVFVVVGAYAKAKPGVTAGCYGIDSAWDDRDAAEARAREVAGAPENDGAWVEAWTLRRAEVLFARDPA